MKTITKITLVLGLLFFFVGKSFSAVEMNRMAARNFLNKTSYIIYEAYDIVYGYNYYTSGNLSKAINHQRYANFLFSIGQINKSVYFSHIAREYALKVIYYCDNYWNNYYRPYYYEYYYNNYYYGSNNRGSWYYNSHNHNNYYSNDNHYGREGHGHGHGYGNHGNYRGRNSGGNNGNYGGSHRKVETNNTTDNTTRTTNTVNSRYSKFSTETVNNNQTLTAVNFDDWSKTYYSNEELTIVKESPAISPVEMEREINTSTISRVTNDNKIVKDDLKEFSAEVNTYRTSNEKEAREISTLKPADFGTTESVTRSTAGKEIAPINNTNRRINNSNNNNAVRRNSSTNINNTQKPENQNATRTNSSTNVNNTKKPGTSSTTRTNNTSTNSTNTNSTRTKTNNRTVTVSGTNTTKESTPTSTTSRTKE